ncbi:MAG TPA: hypothetical protein VK610_10565 [Rhodothermales bacterium]|nr:hypothetical protein [Rhodothermales bacterium]
MRRLLTLSLLALLLPAAAAQPDPYGPPPLTAGSFEITLSGDVNRHIIGTAVFSFTPRAANDPAEPWVLTLRGGDDTFVFQRDAGQPGVQGASIGNGDPNVRRSLPTYQASVLVQLTGDVIVYHSSGRVPPMTANRLRVVESDEGHVLGAFDFAAVQPSVRGMRGTPQRVRVEGRFHALPPGGADAPDLGTFTASIGGAAWQGTALAAGNEHGMQIQLAGGGGAVPGGAGSVTFGTLGSGAVRAGQTFRLVDPATLTGSPPADAMLGNVAPALPGEPVRVFRSGTVRLTAVTAERISGTFTGIAAPPAGMPGTPLAVSGTFEARRSSTAVPPGIGGGG